MAELQMMPRLTLVGRSRTKMRTVTLEGFVCRRTPSLWGRTGDSAEVGALASCVEAKLGVGINISF